MSWSGVAALLLALAALGVAALAAGAFLYGSLLPEANGVPGGGSFLLLSGCLFLVLAGAAVWTLAARRGSGERRATDAGPGKGPIDDRPS